MTQPNPAPERWLPVVGYEGRYEVSDLGRIRNSRTGRVLAPSSDGHYLHVTLSRSGTLAYHRVHRLVGEAFLGPQPPGMETRHGPGGNLDNRLVNLSYGTPLQNSDDQIRDGTRPRGSGKTLAKLTEAIVIECRDRYAKGETQHALAREFGVSEQTLGKAIRGRTWCHVQHADDQSPLPHHPPSVI